MTDTPDPDAPADAPVDRTLSWMPLVGAAVIAAVVLLVLVLVGSGSDHHLGTSTDADGALSCPDTYEVSSQAWVPINPSGVDGGKALVPTQKPSHATVCYYKTSGSPVRRGDARLAGHRTLGGDLHAVTSGLTKLPKATNAPCTSATTADDSYVLGLTFTNGVIWVTAPGDECLGSTNGEFDTASVHGQLQAAYEARRWVG